MENLNHFLALFHTFAAELFTGDIKQWTAAAGTGFLLIAAAEIGDKSQLVCMTLAARHRALPVLLGAIFAFAFLNTLAVVFGAAIASWFPDYIVAGTVAFLFALFGFHSILHKDEDEDDDVKEKSGHGIFFTTFVLITVAEFGDKTQLAVVALSSTALPAAVWLGSTLALTGTSTLGVAAGSTILRKIPLVLLHRISGLIFLCLAGYAGYSTYLRFPPNLIPSLFK